MKELEDIVATERKATLNKIVTCTETPVCSGSRSGIMFNTCIAWHTIYIIM